MSIIDVSGNQGTIDWVAMKADGVTHAWVKATEGATWSDPMYSRNMREARRAGVKPGSYHYARPDNNSPAAEVAHFLKTMILTNGVYVWQGDPLPALDFEAPEAQHMGAATLSAWAHEFLTILAANIHCPPLFYSYPAYIQGALGGGSDSLRKWPLWLAAYGPNDGAAHPVTPPAGFLNTVAHQYTSQGRVAGRYPIDMNRPYHKIEDILVPRLKPPLPPVTEKRFQALRRWIRARREEGWSWRRIKASANWREFLRALKDR